MILFKISTKAYTRSLRSNDPILMKIFKVAEGWVLVDVRVRVSTDIKRVVITAQTENDGLFWSRFALRRPAMVLENFLPVALAPKLKDEDY
jgi:hypothetical protein